MSKKIANQLKNLDPFVDKLIEEKGLDGLEKEVLDQIKVDLKDRIEDVINAKVVEKLPPEKLEEFEKLLDQNTSAQATQKFVKDNIPDLEEVLARVFLNFRQTYLG